MKHPGITKQTPRSQGAAIMFMAKVHKGEKVKQRAPRSKETKAREQPERLLRAEVIKYLRSLGCHVKRLENGVWGKLGRGIPDLMFFTKVTGYNCYPPCRFFFLELKSDKGRLRPEQKEFKELCEKSSTGYILARSVEDLEVVG